jgi:RNA polymerase primary sigma factor
MTTVNEDAISREEELELVKAPRAGDQAATATLLEGKRTRRVNSDESADALHIYLAEVAKHPLLTREEMHALATKFARTRDPAIAEELVTSCLRRVVSIAKKYTGRGLDLLDLIQAGNAGPAPKEEGKASCGGLMKAVNEFDPGRGVPFTAWATMLIKQAIGHAIADQKRDWRDYRIPKEKLQQIRRLRGAVLRLEHELMREPTPEEIAEKMEQPLDKVRELLEIEKNRQPISLETPAGDGDGDATGDTVGDLIEGKEIASLLDVASQGQREWRMRKGLATLSARERLILRTRSGIGAKEHTLAEVGQALGVSAGRISDIAARGERKIRDAGPRPTWREADFKATEDAPRWVKERDWRIRFAVLAIFREAARKGRRRR